MPSPLASVDRPLEEVRVRISIYITNLDNADPNNSVAKHLLSQILYFSIMLNRLSSLLKI